MMIDFNKEIDRSGTFCTQWDYVEDRFGKKGLLPFTISDMDLESPKEIVEALNNRINHKVFGYSRWNHTEFKGAIKNWYKNRYECDIDTDHIVYSPSVIYSVAKIMELCSNEGEGITVFTPAYDAFFKVIEGNNRTVIGCPLKYENYSYSIDFNKFTECIKKSKILLLCNPHNPTGRVWNKNELEKIVAICKEYDVFIISDDIHMDITYKRKYTPVFSVSDYDKVVILTSASKTFNIPALTGSYGIIRNEVLRDKFLFIIKNKDAVSSPSILAVIATIESYNSGEKWLSELLNHTKKNIEFTIEYLNENIEELKCVMPDGAYFAWIDFSGLNVDSNSFQKCLIDIGEVAIMPGNTYGEDSENFIRLNVACSMDKLKDGLSRLKKSCDYIKSKREECDLGE